MPPWPFCGRTDIIFIVRQRSSFRRSRGPGRTDKFGQMQELINDNYSDIIEYCILNIILHIPY